MNWHTSWFDMAWTAMAILSGTGVLYFLFVHRALVRWLASPEKREVLDLEIKVRDLEKELARYISRDPRFIRPQDGAWSRFEPRVTWL